MTHSEYREMLAAYALDAIDARDGEALGRHLATCEDCRLELNGLRNASALLAHAASLEAPGDHVRTQILTQVRNETKPPVSAGTKVLPMPARASRVWPNILRLAAAIAFVALLTGVIVLWRRDARMQKELAQLSQQLQNQQSEQTRNRELMERQKEALALLSSAASRKIQLSGTPAAQTARATVMFDEKTGRAMLMTDGLPATADDKAYEVWFIPKGHAPMPGKVFSVDSNGHAMVVDQIPPEAMKDSVIAITLEPKAGSQTPTMPIYLASQGL
jgi:anti-sigma-K factor RskA